MKTSINNALSSILFKQIALIAAEQNSCTCDPSRVTELACGLESLGATIRTFKEAGLADVSQEQLDIQLAQIELIVDHLGQKP